VFSNNIAPTHNLRILLRVLVDNPHESYGSDESGLGGGRLPAHDVAREASHTCRLMVLRQGDDGLGEAVDSGSPALAGATRTVARASSIAAPSARAVRAR
jgi:hypothetical protein